MNLLIQIGYKILHYLYINRSTLFSLAKEISENPNIKIEGKLNLAEIREYLRLIKKSGLIISKEDEEVPVGADYTQTITIPENKYKNLVEYRQKWPTCAIYSTGRAIMYNTGLYFTQEEHEKVAQNARDLWYLGSNGMTFINAGKVWKNYLKEKGITLEIMRTPVWSVVYQEFTSKGYMSQIGGYITKEFLLDREADGDVDIATYKWNEKKQYLHAWTSIVDAQQDNFKDYLKYNLFENKYFDTFVKKGYAFSWAYIPYVEQKNEVWYYRTIAGATVIEDTKKVAETLWCTETEADERIALMQIVARRTK